MEIAPVNDMPLPPTASKLHDRYGDAHVPAIGETNAVIDCLLGHRSVRSFLPDALPAGTLETLVAAGQSAATSSNLQTWSAIAVEDPARKARLAVLAGNQKHILQCPLLLMFLADVSRVQRLGESHGRDLEGIYFLETFTVAAIDAALAAQNAVVALESLGLGSVYIGAMRNNPEAVAAELGLPPNVMAVFGLCVGYPDPAERAGIKPRLPQSAVLFRERYDAAGEAEAVVGYNETLGAYSERYGMKDEPWSQRVMNRVGTLKALSGRDRMRAALNAMGWPLR